MEVSVTLQDVANIITYIAPGYFAVKTYGIIYCKPDKDTAQLVILSVVYSLPLVAAYNWLFHLGKVSTTRSSYALGLVGFSVAIGLVFATVRRFALVRKVAKFAHLPDPDEDFLRVEFGKLAPDQPVTVKLRDSGSFFSGTPQHWDSYQPGKPRACTFSNVKWFNPKSKQWEGDNNNLIINLDDIVYMETEKQQKHKPNVKTGHQAQTASK